MNIKYEMENYSQFTTRIPYVMASPRGLLAMTLYSPASSGEHLRTKHLFHVWLESLCRIVLHTCIKIS